MEVVTGSGEVATEFEVAEGDEDNKPHEFFASANLGVRVDVDEHGAVRSGRDHVEIGAGIVLISLTSAEGIVFPNHIKGSLALDQVATAKGLVLPKEIDGSLWLNSLTSAEGLNLPDRVSQLIHLEGLPEQELNKIKARYPNYTYKIRT